MTEFGVLLSGEELSATQILAGAQAVERAGLRRVWVSDHYHPWESSQGQSPFVWSVLGAVAATTDLHITTAVTCPTVRIHPAILAQATATMATLAPGRFSFGVGSGEALNEHILGDAWPPASIRLEKLEEALGLIRKLWEGEVVTHEGKHYTVHNAKIWTLPDELPPIYVSGFGPEATALAARIGDGWMTAKPDADGLRQFRAAGNTGRTQGGMKICYGPDADEAAKLAQHLWGHQGVGGQSAQDLPMWHEFEALASTVSPEQVAESIACGPDPEKAAEKVQAYVDAGFDDVYVAQIGPDQEAGYRFLADEVLPLVQQ